METENNPNAIYDQAFDNAYKGVYAPPPPAQPDQQVVNPHARTKSRPDVGAEADKEANNGDENLGVGDYAWDGAVGVASGVESFGKSIGKLANDIAGTVGAKFADDSAFDNTLKTKTWVGGLTSGLTQFALAFLPALGVAGRVGEAVGITSKLAQSLSAGAVADFVGFSDKQERLSNLIEQFPSLKNPVTDFLSSKKDDNFAEGRLKNALEGLGMGLVMHPVMEALKGLKGLAALKSAGDKAGYQELAQQVGEKVQQSLKTLPAEAGGSAKATAANPTVRNWINDKSFDEVGDKIVQHIKNNPDVPFETALKQGLDTHLNYDRIITTKDAEGVQKLAQNIADKAISKLSSIPMKLNAVEDTAYEVADAYGQNPAEFVKAIASDKENIDGVASRLVSYRIMRNTLGQAVVDSANKWLAEGGEDQSKRLTTLAQQFGKVHRDVQFIQTEGARIPSFGRIHAWTSDAFDPDALAQLIDKVMKNGSSVPAQQLARSIVASSNEPNGLSNLFNSMLKTGGAKAGGVLNELHTNAILSGVTTMSTKFLSDTMNAVVLPMERILGGAWQQNRAVMQSGARMYQNIMSGLFDWTHLSEGASQISDKFGSNVSRAVQAFKGGSPLLDHLSDFNQHAAITPENLGLRQGTFMGSMVKYLGETVRLPQKMLVGMDEFWKGVNYKAYVRDEAIRLAQDAGIKDPQEYSTFVQSHIESSFDEAGRATNQAALDYAKSATFQNDLLPGTLGKWVQEGVNNHPLLRMIMPFVKTPTNIFRRAWQMTPGLNMLQDEFRQMVGSADPLVRAQAYGRMTMGGALWTTAIGLAANGRLTGGGPSNPQQKAMLQDNGWQPYSLAIKGDDGKNQYISFKKLEPFAYMLGLAADWSDAHGQMQDEDGDKTATAMLYAMAHHLSSKSYYNGLVELVNALSQPDHKIQQYINNFAGSWVPSIVAKGDDDVYMREAKTMMDAVTRRLPGISDQLPPVRNILGEPVKVPSGYLPFGAEGTDAARMVSPFAYSKQIGDPVHQELADLQYPFSKAPRTFQHFDLTGFHKPDGQDAYDRFQELHGQVQIGGRTMSQSIEKLIQSERYQGMTKPDRPGDDTNPRVMAVREVIASYRQKAMDQTLNEYPQIGQAVRMYHDQARAPIAPNPVLSSLGSR